MLADVKKYKGYEDLSASYMSYVKRGARLRNLQFSVTNEYLWNLFKKQDKKCALTGVELMMDRQYYSHEYIQTASLDRIDSKKGYVVGNLRWVHKRVNIMRGDMTDEEFLTWSNLVVKNNS